jgi:hypothetical protein
VPGSEDVHEETFGLVEVGHGHAEVISSEQSGQWGHLYDLLNPCIGYSEAH